VDSVVEDEGFVDGVAIVGDLELVEGVLRHIKRPCKSIISGSKISPSVHQGRGKSGIVALGLGIGWSCFS